jgi:hypothetical protein
VSAQTKKDSAQVKPMAIVIGSSVFLLSLSLQHRGTSDTFSNSLKSLSTRRLGSRLIIGQSPELRQVNNPAYKSFVLILMRGCARTALFQGIFIAVVVG